MTEPVRIGARDGGGVAIDDEEQCPLCGHDAHESEPCAEPVCECAGPR